MCKSAEPLPSVAVQMPGGAKDSWQLLKEAFAGKVSNDIFTFTNANIISYFVMRAAVDGMPANDMKAINSRALTLFRSGHIQRIKGPLSHFFFTVHMDSAQ